MVVIITVVLLFVILVVVISNITVLIDFKRTKDGIPAKVERLEYDPNRSANIALVLYADGERRYIIAPKGLKLVIQSSLVLMLQLKLVILYHCVTCHVGRLFMQVELKPGKGAQIARSAGAYAQLVARDGALCNFTSSLRRNA